MASPFPPIPRLESLDQGRELGYQVLMLAFNSEASAATFLQSLTFVAQTPKGWDLPSWMAIGLVEGVSQLNPDGDRFEGVLLVIRGSSGEIIRKAHDQGIVCKLDGVGVVTKAVVGTPQTLPPDWLDYVLGTVYILIIMGIAWAVISWLSSD